MTVPEPAVAAEHLAAAPSIVEALSHASELVRAVGKSSRNLSQNYDFRGIDAVVNACAPAFRATGIVVAPTLLSIDYAETEVGRNRSRMAVCRVLVRYTFRGPAGAELVAEVPGEAMDSGDKAAPKAMSVAYRIALLQTLTIPTDEPDVDATAYERSPAPALVGPNTAKRLVLERMTKLRVADPKLAAAAAWDELDPGAGPFPETTVAEIVHQAEALVASGRLELDPAGPVTETEEAPA